MARVPSRLTPGKEALEANDSVQLTVHVGNDGTEHHRMEAGSSPSRQERLALALGVIRSGAARLRRWLWELLKAAATSLWHGATGGRLKDGLAALPSLWRRLLATALGMAAMRLVARCRSALKTSLASAAFTLKLNLLFGAIRLESNCSLQILGGQSSSGASPPPPPHGSEQEAQPGTDSGVLVYSTPSTPERTFTMPEHSRSSVASDSNASGSSVSHGYPSPDGRPGSAGSPAAGRVSLRVQVSPAASSRPSLSRYSQHMELADSSPSSNGSPSVPRCGADPEPDVAGPHDRELVDSVSLPGAPLLMCRSLASQEDVSLKASHSSGLWLPTPRSLSGTPRAHRPHLCRAASPQSPGTSRLARFASPRVLSPSETVNALGDSGGGTPDYYVAHSWRHPAKQAPRRPVPGGAMAAAEGSAGGVEAESEEERPVVRELGEYLRPGGKENAHTAADNSLWTV